MFLSASFLSENLVQPEVRQMDGHRATVWNKIAEDHRRWDFVEMISA